MAQRMGSWQRGGVALPSACGAGKPGPAFNANFHARLPGAGRPRQRAAGVTTCGKGFGAVQKPDPAAAGLKLTKKVYERVVLEVYGGEAYASCMLGCALLSEALKAVGVSAELEDGYLVFDDTTGRTAIWHAWVVANGNVELDVATAVNILNHAEHADIYAAAVLSKELPEGVRRADAGTEQEQSMVQMHQWAAAQLRAGTYWQQALPRHLEMRRRVMKAIKPLLKKL